MELKLSDAKEDDILLPGFRFHPTDEELVGFYLKRKVEMKPIKIDLIKNIDVYKYEPWDLPKDMNNRGGEKEREWYFFCRRGRKYKNSIRPNRVTGCGFWKATGIDKPIYSAGSQFHDHHSSIIIGLKKSLVYYHRGTAGKGAKTDWMMHEFRLPAPTKTSSHNPNTADFQQEAEVWTVCRIFKREVSQKKYASDWRKFSSKQDFNDSAASKICFSESDDGFKYEKFEVSADNNKTERKHNVAVSANNNHFYQSNNQQVPFMANRNNNEVAYCEDGTWDELRPMVEYALYPSIMYSFR